MISASSLVTSTGATTDSGSVTSTDSSGAVVGSSSASGSVVTVSTEGVSAAGSGSTASWGAKKVLKRKPPVTARMTLAAANLKTLNMVWVLPRETKRCHQRRCCGV